MRSLMYFPIIHTEADMGALRESVEQLAVRRLGRQAWRQTARVADQAWVQVERAIAGLELCHPRVRVYQDGLPECGRELEIVAELADRGSRNHRLLLELQENGAAIMGTESPELLVEEYKLMQAGLEAREGGPGGETARQELLARRDRHIAGRINGTLQEGETGILLIGALHRVAELLDRDIRVTYPLYKPIARGGEQA